MSERLKFNEIGYWTEVKLEIPAKYAAAYSRILTAQSGLRHVYIDGFAGAGEHLSRTSGEIVSGSPLKALSVDPPFREFYFVDLDGDKIEHLRERVGDRADVHLFRGDCNEVLLNVVFPKVRWEDYRRGLCLLDPYGLHLHWEVIKAAGQLKTIDLFLNFPIMDANMNVLWRNPAAVAPDQAARLTGFWGDESWRTDIYRRSPQKSLFFDEVENADNDVLAEAFRRRLREVAGFANVPEPMPMRNSHGAVVYYLYFASQKNVANDIVEDIFRKYGKQGA